MFVNKGHLSILIAVTFLIVPAHLHAAPVLTEVKIGNTNVPIPAGATSVNIAGNYACGGGNITINNYGGTARVDITSDSTADLLGLRQAEIVASGGAVTSCPIVFSGKLEAPPSVPAGGVVWYHSNATGMFSPATAAQNGDSIQVTGSIDPDSSAGPATWNQIGNQLNFIVATCPQMGCNVFSPTLGYKTAESVNSLANDRDLKGEVTVTLRNANDKLRITAGVLVKDGPPPGGGDQDDEMLLLEKMRKNLELMGKDLQEIRKDLQETKGMLKDMLRKMKP